MTRPRTPKHILKKDKCVVVIFVAQIQPKGVKQDLATKAPPSHQESQTRCIYEGLDRGHNCAAK